MLEFSFFCPSCKEKVHGVATERGSMDLDVRCYSCNTNWEKVIVDRGGMMKDRLVYPTDNKALRFFGDVMLTIGQWFMNIGIRYGGLYEFEFEDDDV